jgi:Mn2+/Fe2+ NRAMP family transporter
MLWVLALGTVCVIFLTEMAGRLACVSHHSLVDAVRERCGFRYFSFLLIGEVIVDMLVLAAELGGVAIALHLVTGIDYRWFVPIVAFVLWLLIWLGTFSMVQNGSSLLGLITLAFVLGMWWMGPPWHEAMKGLIPSAPSHDAARYWFTAVGIIGALFEPFMLNFYASGAIERSGRLKDIPMNRVTAVVGDELRSDDCVQHCHPQCDDARTERYSDRQLRAGGDDDAAAVRSVGRSAVCGRSRHRLLRCVAAGGPQSLVSVRAGIRLNWSENLKPHEDARFALIYTLAIPLGAVLVVVLGDPLQITTFSMALNALLAPVIVLPAADPDERSPLHARVSQPCLR